MKPNRKNERFFVNRVKRKLLHVSKKGIVTNLVTGRVIGSPNNAGYAAIGQKDKKGKVRHILVHRLMWLVYKGDIPDGMEVNHKDGVKAHNRLSNFELVTGSRNMRHAHDAGLVDMSAVGSKLRMQLMGHRSTSAIFSQKEARKIRKLYKTKKYSQRKLGKIFGASHATIGLIVNNKSYAF